MKMVRFCPNCGTKVEPGNKFCGSCGNRLDAEVSNINNDEPVTGSKKNIVLGTEKKSNYKLLFTAFYIVVLFGGIVFYFATTQTKEEEIISEQPEVLDEMQYPESRVDMQPIVATVKNGTIIIPLSEVLDKKFVRFLYQSSQAEIPMLAYINEDGKLVTSISMCEPCNSTTFHIIGDELICNSCGSTWDINNLEEISGSCGKYPPDPVPSKVVGNEIHIDEAAVLSWKRRV